MTHRTLFIGLLAAFASLAPSLASAGERAVPPPKISVGTQMDLEIIGTFQSYANLQVALPLSTYADAVSGSQRRRQFLPPANARGHSIASIAAIIENLRERIGGRGSHTGVANQHNVIEWNAEIATWLTVRRAVQTKLDGLLRAGNKRGDTVLAEHGITNFANLEQAATSAWQSQGQNVRIPHMAAAIRAARNATDKLATTAEISDAPASFAGRWDRKGAWWGPMNLRMVSRTKLVGTYRRGHNARLEGTLTSDGKTMAIRYWDKAGVLSKNTYYMRIPDNDPNALHIWATAFNKEILRRQ